MRDELLAYLLNDLDEEQRSRIESRLDSDPNWQHELERLRSYIEAAPTINDEEEQAENTLPVDLVKRTCSFVEQASSQGELSPAVLPPLLSESQDAISPKSRRWSLVDLGVAASILLMLGTLLLPAIQASRIAARRAQCKSNLYTLGKALVRFTDQSKHQQIPTIGRNENAGMYTVKLVEGGILTREQIAELIVCPSKPAAEDAPGGDGFSGDALSDAVIMRIPTKQELANTTGTKLPLLLMRMGGGYAYRVGYIDQPQRTPQQRGANQEANQERGEYRQFKFTHSSKIPMMADKPSPHVHGYQSDNHGGCGQNVLFEDLSVRYITACIQQGSDGHWYLNHYGEAAAGSHPQDVVLLRSEVFPVGKSLLPKINR